MICDKIGLQETLVPVHCMTVGIVDTEYLGKIFIPAKR